MRADIHLLGGFSVVVDGREVPDEAWRRRQAALLVKLLALQPGRRMRREALIDALWPDLLVDEAAPRLHKAAFYARAALDVRDGVVLTGDTVALLPEAEVTVDVDRFDAAVARSDDLEAVAQYRGDLLPDDVYEPWTEEPRERRRVQYLRLLRELGRWEDLLEQDPLDEEAHLELVAEHIRARDRQGALRRLDLMDQTFRRELGTEPSDEAQALRETAVALPAVDPEQALSAVGTMTPVPLPPTATIGRTDEICRVLDLLDHARVVTLLGPGGVGKTRLALEVAARRRDERAVDACFVDLTKVTDASLVPDLIARELGARLGGSAEQAVQEALRGHALLLVLDNFEHVVDAAPVVSGIVGWSHDVE
ncbi:MAG: AAA family ATPase, partial [Nocardioidaceae bacterium]